MKKLIQTVVLSLGMLCAGFAFAESVDINTASATELATAINGVGEKKAEAIIKYRDTHGPFQSVNDLMKVQGIGPGILSKNQENLTLASEQKKPGHQK